MKKRVLTLLLTLCMLVTLAPFVLAAESGEIPVTLREYDLDRSFYVVPVGRYANWAGVSNVSQFTDQNGNFCFAVDEEGQVTVYYTDRGTVTKTVTIQNPYSAFGGAACDEAGDLYMVWGYDNETNDTDTNTILVSKYTADGKHIATVGGNGSEGMDYYYDKGFYTKYPFDAGNCDVAINGDVLLVNYARKMYSGHQANTVFAVNTKTMSVLKEFIEYNSHSFDQRVTPYEKTGGFLLESLGDCFPRAFTTTLTNERKVQNKLETFHFWVEPGAYDDYNMFLMNNTRARLGNIFETPDGAALVAASARSLSEHADSEPYDVFIQIFDPAARSVNASTFTTSGTRSGLAGNNGDTRTTDYGVQWLTDLEGTGRTAEVVQAVNVGQDKIAVLFELAQYNRHDSTWLILLNSDGSILQEPIDLGSVYLNIDEDPVYAQGAIQWVSNPVENEELVLYSLILDAAEEWPEQETKQEEQTESKPDDDQDGKLNGEQDNKQNGEQIIDIVDKISDVPENAYYAEPVAWAVERGITSGTSASTFSPNKNCTRAQMVTFLWRAAGEPEPASKKNPFNDVKSSQYYYKAVLWAVEQGITTGTGKQTFSPNAAVTRAQTVTFLWRMAGEPTVKAKNPFSDVKAGQYYYDAVLWAVKNEITTGKTKTSFAPSDPCTRAQIVTFLYRDLA